jgi:hypothetical protein
MRSRFAVIIGLLVVATAAVAQAQTSTQTKTPQAGIQVSTYQITGEVMWIEGNELLVKLRPSGLYQFFDVKPGRKFVIDGKQLLIGDLKMGTVLTATVVTKTQPISVRTTTVTNGTVLHVQGNFVIAKLENGDIREYVVPESYKFVVEGKPASVQDLKKGMKISGTRITEEPLTEMSEDTLVSGMAPK